MQMFVPSAVYKYRDISSRIFQQQLGDLSRCQCMESDGISKDSNES